MKPATGLTAAPGLLSAAEDGASDAVDRALRETAERVRDELVGELTVLTDAPADRARDVRVEQSSDGAGYAVAIDHPAGPRLSPIFEVMGTGR